MARIVAAMSGGVDSSVTAALLQEQGHDVVGVHMRLHDKGPTQATAGACCGVDDALDARAVADQLGIPFYVLDLREAFRQAVLDPFVDAYVGGRTPNPCVACNGVLKFRVLLARALALGASHLATGHYARIAPGPVLQAAVDPAKDQSYFLFPVTRKALAHTLFPLGDMTKDEVRQHAERLGLATASKAESMDVCFLPEGDHARLVAEQHPDTDGAGAIVDASGRELGRHEGYWRFTIGQRRGLGISTPEPVYVTRIDPGTRRVTVGPVGTLARSGLVADGCVWSEQPAVGQHVRVRIRHRGSLLPARVLSAPDADAITLHFDEPAVAVSPGQAAVVYDGDRVLGGGWIRHAVAAA